MRLLGTGKKRHLRDDLEVSNNVGPLAYNEPSKVTQDFSLQQVEDLSMNDLVRALTDQFSNIDPENSMDLSAVGMALSEIPAEMPGLTDKFSSFREEILSSLL